MCRKITYLFTLLIILVLVVSLVAQGEELRSTDTPLPLLADKADALTATQRDELIALYQSHNATNIGRLFVLILAALPETQTIEVYAKAAINVTPLQDGERNDRILIVVAIKDRKIRIETSRDVWEMLTDEECAAIIREQITPQFRKQNYYQGLADGIAAMLRKLKTAKE